MAQLVCLYHRSNTNIQIRHVCCNCRRTQKKNQFTIVTQHSQLEGKRVWHRAWIWLHSAEREEKEETIWIFRTEREREKYFEW